MNTILRREFLRTAARGAAGAVAGSALFGCAAESALADPLGLPIGVQLYTVEAELKKSFFGTLKRIAIIGYREVETAGFFDHNADEWRHTLGELQLRCPSAHCVKLEQADDEILRTADFCKELGVECMVCASPNLRDAARRADAAKPGASLDAMMTLDDWHWTAERLNQIGALLAKSGMRFGYHNHNREFTSYGGVIAFDELLRLTDPKLVAFEMDCGWVVAAGYDPVKYLEKFPQRIQMLHVKDQKSGFKASTGKDAGPTTEIGRGAVDWKRVFTAAKFASVRHYFVEQEPPFSEMPALDALRVSYEYLHQLSV
jgi:sugar phosphate isomerase/epimerase